MGTTQEVIGWFAAVLMGLVASAFVLAFGGSGQRLDRRHALAGAVAAGLALFMIGADLFVAVWRAWWAQRPVIGAFITGLLLLGLTLIFIDRVVERRRSEALRSLFDGPVTDLVFRSIVGDLSDAHRHLGDVMEPSRARGDLGVRWSQQPDLQRGLEALTEAVAAMSSSARELRGDVLAGGEQMHDLYRALWSLEQRTRQVNHAVDRLRSEFTPMDDSMLRGDLGGYEDRIRYLDWLWNQVRRAYNTTVEAIQSVAFASGRIQGAGTGSKGAMRVAVPDLFHDVPAEAQIYLPPERPPAQ